MPTKKDTPTPAHPANSESSVMSVEDVQKLKTMALDTDNPLNEVFATVPPARKDTDEPYTPYADSPVLRRVIIKVGFTIPTGNYANLTPSIEEEWEIPDNAAYFDRTEALDNTRQSLVMSIIPMVRASVSSIPIKLLVQGKQGEAAENAVGGAYVAHSKLFEWLVSVSRVSARNLIREMIANIQNGGME